MSFRVRPAGSADLGAIYEMAKLTGGGFTNLPADKGSLAVKLERSEDAFSRDEGAPHGDLFVFVLENVATGQVRGTCQVFSRVGLGEPFYSYRIGTLTQTSPELGKTFRADMLTLCTDFEGSSEVGGLFLHPNERAGGLGVLLARSRYLFIRLHRDRFADRVLAELRGVIDEAGGSPFWDAIAGRFFGMNFQEADTFNAAHGTRFIADLMPKTPIYTAMLPESARAIMSVPHPSGRAAMRMLEQEGFSHDGYVDIFDGGPTMSAATDRIRTIRERARADARRHRRGERRDANDGRGRASQGFCRRLRPCPRVWAAKRRSIPRRQRGSVFLQATRSSPSGARMPLVEINFDGIVGPSHNYAGLSLGNLASTASRGALAFPRAAALQGVAKMRANLKLGLEQGILLPHRRPNAAWLAELGTNVADAPDLLRAAAFSASAMWAANAATVSPAPDTEDGRCHLAVANLRTMAHRSHEWPETLGQLRLAFADVSHFAVHPPVPATFGDEGAANHMRMAPAHGEPGVEIFVYGEGSGAFPARQHVEASRAIARLNRLDPARTLFVRQSEAAIAAGAFHNDVVAVANETVLFAHEQAFADKEDVLRRAQPPFARGRDRRSAGFGRQPGRRGQILSVQRPAGELARWRHGADPARGGARNGFGLVLARNAGRRQWADPCARTGRRSPIHGQWRRPRLPQAARRRRSRRH